MIPTHVLGLLLSPSAQENAWYQLFLPSTGYVAVAFIFCAGAASWIVFERKAELYRRFSPELLKHLRRVGFILLTAYWFNLSAASWSALKSSPAALQRWLAFDVLQVIGFSLLLALLILQFVKSARLLKCLFLIVGFAIYAAAPLVWAADLSGAPLLIQSFFGRPPATAFPFFPWVGHFFLGAALTGFLLQAKRPLLFAALLLLASAAAPSIIFYVHDLPFQYPGWQEDWWYCNPGNALLRLSKVTFLFSALYALEPLLKKAARAFAPLILLGQESLQVYVFHIILVYGRPFFPGLGSRYAQSLSMVEGLSWTLGLSLLCWMMAWSWHQAKRRRPQAASAALAIFYLGFLAYFFSS